MPHYLLVLGGHTKLSLIALGKILKPGNTEMGSCEMTATDGPC